MSTHARNSGRRRRDFALWCYRLGVGLGGLRCTLCGEEFLKVADVTVDHIVPVSRGGDDSYSNFQPAHKRCNGRKGNTEPK